MHFLMKNYFYAFMVSPLVTMKTTFMECLLYARHLENSKVCLRSYLFYFGTLLIYNVVLAWVRFHYIYIYMYVCVYIYICICIYSFSDLIVYIRKLRLVEVTEFSNKSKGMAIDSRLGNWFELLWLQPLFSRSTISSLQEQMCGAEASLNMQMHKNKTKSPKKNYRNILLYNLRWM